VQNIKQSDPVLGSDPRHAGELAHIVGDDDQSTLDLHISAPCDRRAALGQRWNIWLAPGRCQRLIGWDRIIEIKPVARRSRPLCLGTARGHFVIRAGFGQLQPSYQACEDLARAACRPRRHQKCPEQAGKLSMPLFDFGITRRANGRNIAHPGGPIVAKRCVIITAAPAAAERGHG
jgi:hypothetical protein